MVRRIEATDAIEVYISDKMYVCIKQENPMGEDAVVAMLPLHVPRVIKWLQEAAAQVEGETVGITDE
jgi:hypothetical protein